MDKQKVTYFSRYWVFLLIFVLIVSTGFTTLVSAREFNQYDLDQAYGTGVERSYGATRLKATERKRCKSCEQKEADVISEYLDRVLKEKGSVSYDSKIESIIFADSKFVNGCWKKANKKRLEIFLLSMNLVQPVISLGFQNTESENVLSDISLRLNFLT